MDKFLTEEFDKPVNKKLIEYIFKIGERKKCITPKVIHEFIKLLTPTKSICYSVNGKILEERYKRYGYGYYRINEPAIISYFDGGTIYMEDYCEHDLFESGYSRQYRKDGPHSIIYYKSGNVNSKYYKIKDSDGSKVIRRIITYFENGEIEKVEEE